MATERELELAAEVAFRVYWGKHPDTAVPPAQRSAWMDVVRAVFVAVEMDRSDNVSFPQALIDEITQSSITRAKAPIERRLEKLEHSMAALAQNIRSQGITAGNILNRSDEYAREFTSFESRIIALERVFNGPDKLEPRMQSVEQSISNTHLRLVELEKRDTTTTKNMFQLDDRLMAVERKVACAIPSQTPLATPGEGSNASLRVPDEKGSD